TRPSRLHLVLILRPTLKSTLALLDDIGRATPDRGEVVLRVGRCIRLWINLFGTVHALLLVRLYGPSPSWPYQLSAPSGPGSSPSASHSPCVPSEILCFTRWRDYFRRLTRTQCPSISNISHSLLKIRFT